MPATIARQGSWFEKFFFDGGKVRDGGYSPIPIWANGGDVAFERISPLALYFVCGAWGYSKMRALHRTATTPDRPIGILTNTSMAEIWYTPYALVLAVSLHWSATLQRIVCAFVKFVLWIPALTVKISRFPAAAPNQLRPKVRPEETITIP